MKKKIVTMAKVSASSNTSYQESFSSWSWKLVGLETPFGSFVQHGNQFNSKLKSLSEPTAHEAGD
jgi:hypothetical protein